MGDLHDAALLPRTGGHGRRARSGRAARGGHPCLYPQALPAARHARIRTETGGRHLAQRHQEDQRTDRGRLIVRNVRGPFNGKDSQK